LGALLGGLAWASVGCAGERDPINRVQANAMPKSFFIGNIADNNADPEFYIHADSADVFDERVVRVLRMWTHYE